jgi:hypothetical protein
MMAVDLAGGPKRYLNKRNRQDFDNAIRVLIKVSAPVVRDRTTGGVQFATHGKRWRVTVRPTNQEMLNRTKRMLLQKTHLPRSAENSGTWRRSLRLKSKLHVDHDRHPPPNGGSLLAWHPVNVDHQEKSAHLHPPCKKKCSHPQRLKNSIV